MGGQGSMTVGSLFAGIGGFDLGLERAGFEIKWQVENDEYCNRVLAKHWPRVKRYGDIRSIDWRTIPRVDLVCGGFPCQPFSLAGQRRGQDDDRYLWPEMRLAVLHAEPTWVIAENVPGLIGPALDEVLSDLEAAGYETGTLAVPACAVGAPHIRQRIWILAHARRFGDNRRSSECGGQEEAGACYRATRSSQYTEHVADADHSSESNVSVNGVSGNGMSADDRGRHHAWQSEPDVGLLADGLPDRLVQWSREPEGIPRTATGIKDGTEQLKGLGNAVVPQVVEWLGRQIVMAQSRVERGPESEKGVA
jgi:DNA (cytosine-5)-methyltransferase 1